MRWLMRSLIFWAVSAPLFYLFGLPFLIGKLETKSRAASFTACQAHLKDENIAYAPASIISPAQADAYCHCVSDPIAFTNADLFDLAQKKQPERLTAAMKPALEACNATLQQSMNNAINSAPATRSTWEPDGTETVHFQ